MNAELYPMIFKRKSFHTFKDHKSGRYFYQDDQIPEEGYDEILQTFDSLVPLYPEIRVRIRIAENEETSCTRGQEKVILFYSEEKENALMNIGYLGEQLDLHLASKNIGTLWFGLNKKQMPDHEGLKYVIMMAIAKVPETAFRKDMFKATRKDLTEIWEGDEIFNVSDIVRFAPSACNTQPWSVRKDGDHLSVYRYISPKKKGVMPRDGLIHYNHIDIGIFLCFLELSLEHEGITYERSLHPDIRNEELNLVATYKLLSS